MDIKKVNIDLMKDCRNIVRNKLENIWEKEEIKNIKEKDLILTYFNAIYRIFIAKKPRKIKLSSVFRVSEDLKEGWEFLKGKIINGEDLMPHLSGGHKSPTNKDYLLNDWNIHHLHLGTIYNEKGMIKRTGPVLFAVITDNEFYALKIYKHGNWANQEAVKIIDENWPKLHERYIFNIKGDDKLTDKQISILRKKGGNYFTKLGEGRFLTGAISLSGHQIESIILSDNFQYRIIETEKEIINNCSKIIDEIYSSMQMEIDLSVSEITILLKTFEADDNKIILYIPEINCNFSLNYEHGKAENYMALFNDLAS